MSADTTIGAIDLRAGVAEDWLDVGPTEVFWPDRGAAVLVDGVPLAVFRIAPIDPAETECWYCVSHLDPVTAAPVIARGLVGSTGDGVVFVASPLHKERYGLTDGAGLDGEAQLECREIRVHNDRVLVSRS